MSLSRDIELMEEFERWKGEKKVAQADFSPMTFMIERAKEQAYQKLEVIAEELEAWECLDEEERTTPEELVAELRRIINDG